MSKKRIKWTVETLTLEKAFDAFVISQMSKGIKDKTIQSYRTHFKSLSKHIDMKMTFEELTKRHIEQMILSMRESNLAHNSISSYARVMKTFLNWCKSEGHTTVEVPTYKQIEVVKEGYSDEELEKLLKRPSPTDSFCEYRNWVIINFLLNSGCRSATIRNIQNQDVNLEANQVIFRHTKNGKIQSIPLCSQMALILRSYMKVRKGKDSDFLFCDAERDNLLQQLREISMKNADTEDGIVIAAGMAVKLKGESFHDVFHRVDKNMYLHKDILKEKRPSHNLR